MGTNILIEISSSVRREGVKTSDRKSTPIRTGN